MSFRRAVVAYAFLLMAVASAPARGATYWGPTRTQTPLRPAPVQPNEIDQDEYDAAMGRLAFKAVMVGLGLIGLFKVMSRLGGGND